MCFRHQQLLRLIHAVSRPEITAIFSGAVKLVYRHEMVVLGRHQVHFFFILIFSWIMGVFEKWPLAPILRCLNPQNRYLPFRIDVLDARNTLRPKESVEAFLIVFNPYRCNLLSDSQMSLRWNKLRWNDMKMTWNDMKWHAMTWNDMKWQEMTWNIIKWDETQWNNMRWYDKMKWNLTFSLEMTLKCIFRRKL